METSLAQAQTHLEQLCQQCDVCLPSVETRYNQYVEWRIAVSQLRKKLLQLALSIDRENEGETEKEIQTETARVDAMLSRSARRE